MPVYKRSQDESFDAGSFQDVEESNNYSVITFDVYFDTI